MSGLGSHIPVILCILDGWGYRAETKDNAIALAATPNWDRMNEIGPACLLHASEQSVGLPDGQMGNSEVGHINLGAGRVALQDLPRIDAAIRDGSFAKNATLEEFVSRLRASGGSCHLLGLLSPGGVHSSQIHLETLARVVSERGVPVAVHAFLDGRDTPPESAREYMNRFQKNLSGQTNVSVSTVSGRYFAMDRDKRWERVARAYDTLVSGTGNRAENADAAIAKSYAEDISDEFVVPTAIGCFDGMKAGDGLIMGNFRADRAREILSALVDTNFDGFARTSTVDFAATCGMVSYSRHLDGFLSTLFPPDQVQGTLGEIVSTAGLRQLRIAETEKYAHVTFFFNGGEERVFPGEERILVPSPRIPTYDRKPEMSAYEVTDKLCEELAADRFHLVIVNYANADMVGHTGNLNAAIRAVEAVDRCLGKLLKSVNDRHGTLLVTADHGNAEMMRDASTGQPHTAHTSCPVPFIMAGANVDGSDLRDGRLADVAPTILDLMGLSKPSDMTGCTLIVRPTD